LVNIDQLILGANPLVGVDHFSRARGRDRYLMMNPNNVFDTMDSAFVAGAQGFNFGVDPSIYKLLREMKEKNYDRRFGMYLILPDMRTYAGAYLSGGPMGVMKELLNNLSWSEKAKAIAQGGLTVLTADPVRAEIAPRKAELKTVLAFEAITEMILSFRLQDFLTDYVSHLADTFRIRAGFVTRNFTRFVKFCEDCNMSLDDIIIMTPFNRLGFQMNPSRESCEDTLSRLGSSNVIAMSLLAGGALSLDDAIQYINMNRSIKSVAIGLSSPSHARETFGRLQSALGRV
jgi:hypothetical protein